jgi:hypothetical protein
MLPVSLDCVVFLFCFSPSCLPYVACYSGLCYVFVLFLQGRQDGEKQNKTQHNPAKLATKDRQVGEKQNKNTTQSRETDNIG